MAISKQFLSGSTNGRGILIAASASAGTTLHTAHATSKDEVHIYFSNDNSIEEIVQIEFGGTTDPNDVMQIKVPPNETVLGLPGICISNSLVVKAYSTTANKVSAFGFVNRIS